MYLSNTPCKYIFKKKIRKGSSITFNYHGNNGFLNASVDRINSIDTFGIALLKELSLFGFPSIRVLTILSSNLVKMLASIVAILSKRTCL